MLVIADLCHSIGLDVTRLFLLLASLVQSL